MLCMMNIMRLVKNDTWLLVPSPAGVNMVRSMRLFKHKFYADGTLRRYKACLVANDSSQQLGVDFDETFSPVVKPAIVRTVFSLDVSHKWPIHQLDVKNAFLNGDLFETVYMHQPYGFVDNRGLRVMLHELDFIIVDVILYCLSIDRIICSLNNEFEMTDLGAPNYFLGISADRTPAGLFLSQKKYALQLFERAHMVTCNPSRTLVDTESKLVPEGVPVQDPTLYRSRAWGLQYLTFTCPTLSYAIQQIYLYMHDSREPHFAALKRVANVIAETAWVRNLLRELHSPLMTATLVYCDKVSVVYMSANPDQHQRTKQIEIDIHFVRDMVTTGHVRVLHVPSRFHYADIFTKGLSSALFEEFRSSLSVRLPSALTAWAY
uniref:Reverse transcriptase Ty1/copia-type domain-containing protein n=1 Tax=Tanacetum cinerariifolium TaxID=118510 RepID=A0A6L2JP37_TANCI|nr:hypothetical protein [Tanacetum cinerariifolium]